MKNRPGFEPIRDVLRFVAIGSPDRGAQAKLTLIGSSDCVVFVTELENRDDGPELFTADNLVLLPGSEHQRRQQEISIRPFSRIELPASRHHLQIRCATAAQQAADEIELSFVIEWSHCGFGLQ